MRQRLATALLGVAVAEAVLWEGGFDPAPRVVFALLAALALAAAAAADPVAAARLARRPAVVVLALLGALGLCSALWTVGAQGDTIRWGLVTLGYGAVAVAAGVLARGGGARRIALGIAVLAVLSGIVGLAGALSGSGPFADRIGGAWRPGGTLEYAPALALLQVSALPVLIGLVRARDRRRRLAGCLGALVAFAVLVLAGSRLELALAVAVVAVTLRWRAAGPLRSPPERRPRARRLAWVAALVLLGVGGVLVTPLGSPSGRRDGGFAHGRVALWRAGLETFADRPLGGAGADAFLVASVRHQRSGPVAFAHDLPLELAAELGVGGLVLALALYGTAGVALRRARGDAAMLLGPAVAAFLIANVVDWPWHLAGSGAVFAVALGGILDGDAHRDPAA